MKGGISVMKEIDKAYDKHLLGQIKKLESLEGDDKSRQTNDVVQLYRARTDRSKVIEDRWIKIAGVGVQLAIAIGGWILYDKWSNRGMKYEETGSVSSVWTRNLNQKIMNKI